MISPRSVRMLYETNVPFCRRIWIDPCNLESCMVLFKRRALAGPTGGITMTPANSNRNWPESLYKQISIQVILGPAVMCREYASSSIDRQGVTDHGREILPNIQGVSTVYTQEQRPVHPPDSSLGRLTSGILKTHPYLSTHIVHLTDKYQQP
jgi:hypothetical protein